jgi:hypothetical protein
MKKLTRKTRVLAFILASSAAALVLDLQLPLGFAGGIPYAAVLAVAWWSRIRGVVLGAGALSTVLILVGFLFSPAPVSPMGIVILNRLFALGIVWILAGLFVRDIAIETQRDRALRERERAQSELKVLSGLIPICGSCKKIRDSEGAWRPLETYISQHSEAQFSHGICRDCARREFGIEL